LENFFQKNFKNQKIIFEKYFQKLEKNFEKKIWKKKFWKKIFGKTIRKKNFKKKPT